MRIRPADLYVTEGYQKPGIILVGDAFSTSCPAAGTGAGKAINDVAQLCTYIPGWLATPGMGDEKIAAYYADEVKQGYDAFALDKAFRLRANSIDPSLRYALRRWAAFLARAAMGGVRRAKVRLHVGEPQKAPEVRHV
jgi:hypothetical protein